MKRILAAVGCVCVLLMSGCGDSPRSRQTVALDTSCAVTIYDGEDALLDECMAHLRAREALWSKTVATSDIATLNKSGTAVVDDDTAALLIAAKSFSETTDGAFDITTASLVTLWDNAEKEGVIPDKEAIAAALACVGGDNMIVDGNAVTLLDGAEVDLGGIAKGAIADELAAMLKDGGCESALIDLGGNIVALGDKHGEPFHIGIADPQNSDKLALTIAVSDKAVVTSGSYERGYDIDGTHYSHIIDPQTGYPVKNDLLSVTIVCPSATTADALSTACFVKGYKGAKALLSHYPEAEAVFILSDSTIETTKGIDVV